MMDSFNAIDMHANARLLLGEKRGEGCWSGPGGRAGAGDRVMEMEARNV